MKTKGYLSLVNEDNMYDYNMVADLEFINVDVNKDMNEKQEFIETKTYEAFKALKEELAKQGIVATINSAGRTVLEQEEYLRRETQKLGFEKVEKRIATPGCSEHHLGLAIDVRLRRAEGLAPKNKILARLDNKKMYKIAHSMLENYGFILRYPKNKSDITMVDVYEPWHFRYVGLEHAKEMNKLKMCLEEYVEYLKEQENKADEGLSL